MPRICTVCAHLLRAEIDERLAFQVVNVSDVARHYGLDRKSVARHRDQHLPHFLRAFAGGAAVLDMSTIRAEAQRLYLTTLDALARAEQATLARIDDNGKARPRVSNTSIARFIREARQGLDLLAKLSAERPREEVRPSTSADVALGEEIRKQLARVVARSALREVASGEITDAELLDE